MTRSGFKLILWRNLPLNTITRRKYNGIRRTCQATSLNPNFWHELRSIWRSKILLGIFWVIVPVVVGTGDRLGDCWYEQSNNVISWYDNSDQTDDAQCRTEDYSLAFQWHSISTCWCQATSRMKEPWFQTCHMNLSTWATNKCNKTRLSDSRLNRHPG